MTSGYVGEWSAERNRKYRRRITRVCSGLGDVRWHVTVFFRRPGFGAWRHLAAETQGR